ncbi:hypothetical protein KFE25_011999 [Diacronema lutheri]|uniref:acylphosphatase n=2 Tax=Diacronema lutheri TaxID=2081491 RepID=A0A8J5X7L3_DIALT|nr:hypothetical protein KFE25_011999 [Diacronema lutheri]
MSDATELLVRLEFCVHGKVQRVHMRAYTKRKANELGLCGWCRNTPEGTVVGVAEGHAPSVAALRHWLATEGSPAARIDRLDVTRFEQIGALSAEFVVGVGASALPLPFSVDKSYGHAPRAPRASRLRQPERAVHRGALQAADKEVRAARRKELASIAHCLPSALGQPSEP